MKISYSWLKSLLNFHEPPEEVAVLLTNSGLEVESLEKVEAIKGGLKGLIVGEVVEKSKHPDADKLSLTKVNVGGTELLNIVCGAPNVEAGQKVVVAPVGVKLFPTQGDPFVIKKSKIRGAVSEGMLCAEDEIGIGKSHDGIMVLKNDAMPGNLVCDYFNLSEDTVFEIGLTPNRGDAASHFGVARELATILNSLNEENIYEPKIKGTHELNEPTGTLKINTEVLTPEACNRYCGVVITGIEVSDSPEWLKNSLNSIGIRSVNNIVDITNYVLHETGQPLHAFDAFKIKNNRVVVRTATANETFTLLDGSECKLSEDDLVICDHEKPMCLAGIFGGLDSGVTVGTTAIFLEAAYFNSDCIRRSSKRHGLKTDSSFRFERGTDPDMIPVALKRAANLILEIAGGNIASEMIDIYPNPIASKRIAFSYQNSFSLIGKEIPKTKVKNILTSLGMKIITEGNDGLVIDVPPFKSDVFREADVTEEILRIYGYNNVSPSGKFNYSSVKKAGDINYNLENNISELLVSFGFHEIMSNSLSRQEYYQEDEKLVHVLNSISNELGILRKSMIFSGLEAVAYNVNRKNTDLKLFDLGKTYIKDSTAENDLPYKEERHLSLFLHGNIFSENPYHLNKKADFSCIKAYLDSILIKSGVETTEVIPADAHEHFSYGLVYKWKNKPFAAVGKLKKNLATKFDIKEEVFCCDINWDFLNQAVKDKKIEFNDIPKFPFVKRDLALLLDKKIKFDEIVSIARQTEKKLLKEINLFDVYEGEKIDISKKSYAISLTFQDDDRTLTEVEVEKAIQKMIAAFNEKLKASIR
ncbi:MAG: phenylalanine--tRNA ligase subunit beta [Bacteroidota bacterium]